jgi:hypothetical protein
MLDFRWRWLSAPQAMADLQGGHLNDWRISQEGPSRRYDKEMYRRRSARILRNSSLPLLASPLAVPRCNRRWG